MTKRQPTEKWLKKYHEYLERNGLKSSSQRDVIVHEFLKTKGHLSADELHAKLRAANSGIGLATVYRALKILTLAGLAQERKFNDGFTRYEISGPDERHHDHIVCLSCNRVLEFANEEIEELQRKVAATYKFRIIDHRLEIYGICAECASKEV